MRERIFILSLLALGAAMLANGVATADAANLELPSVDAQIVYAPCPSYAEPISCASYSTRTIFLTTDSARTLAHERCHFIDHDFLTDADRAAFMGVRGLAEWDRERFANDCALCAVGKKWRAVRKIIQPPCGWLKRTL